MLAGIIYREGMEEAKSLARKAVDYLAARGVKARRLDSQPELSPAEPASEENFSEGIDFAVVFGGDGTLLRAAQLIKTNEIPVVGVKLGGLGFLTEVRPEELFIVLDQVLSGKARALERMMLAGKIAREHEEIRFRALNEVTVSCAGMPRVIELETRINGVFVTSFRADGLLVATPTGSTAYTMAAGGPIVHPEMKAITITPICPHTLTSRPLVIPHTSAVSVSLADSSLKRVHISPDAQQVWPLERGQTVEITAAEKGLKLVCSPSMNYYEILRTKLRWGER